jgi:hypothetical protein
MELLIIALRCRYVTEMLMKTKMDLDIYAAIL